MPDTIRPIPKISSAISAMNISMIFSLTQQVPDNKYRNEPGRHESRDSPHTPCPLVQPEP
jgi:hypothetical protein